MLVLAGTSNTPQGMAMAVLKGLLILGSVLIHELGHALVARRYRLFPIDITLHGLGGYTRHGGARSPGQGLAVTAAGPFASFLLSIAFFGLGMVIPNGYVANFCLYGGAMNAVWVVFNLLPMYPLDGGLLVFHGLSFRLSRESALRWAARLGVVVGALVGGWALWTGQYLLFFIVAMQLWRSVPVAFSR